jgi:hypothetical protein
MGQESAQGLLAAFDRPPAAPVKLLNVDLSTVTTAADLVSGLGEPLEEIIHLDFQSSAAARKHADLLAYIVPLFAHYLVPVHAQSAFLKIRASLGERALAYAERMSGVFHATRAERERLQRLTPRSLREKSHLPNLTPRSFVYLI